MKRKGVKLIMSEYADIVIGNLSLHWFRNYLDSKIVSLFFSKNDLIVVNNCNIDDDDKDAGNRCDGIYQRSRNSQKCGEFRPCRHCQLITANRDYKDCKE